MRQPTDLAPTGHLLRDVTVRGVRTRVLEAGVGNERALVLVHGFLTNHAMYDDVIDAFAQRFHVIVPDLPGFGESEKPSPTRYAYGIDAFTEVIADLIAAFGLGRASVVGHGFGGAVGVTLATSHAELVERLVIVDALCYKPTLSFRSRLPQKPVLGTIWFKQILGRRTFRSFFRDDVFGPEAAVPIGRVDARFDSFNAPAARESAYAVMQALLDTRAVVARVPRVHVPTLVVWGRDDKLLPFSHAQRLAREIPGAKLEIMSAGHSPPEERPEDFVRVVTHFLEGLRG